MIEPWNKSSATRHRGRTFRTVRLALVVALFLCGPSTAWATGIGQSGCGRLLRAQDTVWLVSTRHLRCVGQQDGLPLLRIWQRQAGNGWEPATADRLCARDESPSTTVVFCHGNRIDRRTAIQRGLIVYRKLAAQTTSATPLRLVIWSWPSDQIRGPIRDARVKAQRTDLEGYLLGCLLSRMEPHAPVSLIGYSFGVRIATGTLHLLAGGSVAGWVLPHPPEEKRTPLRVVAIAGAVENIWLLPCQRHGLAMDLVDRMLVMYNPCDSILKRYPLIAGSRSGHALGYSGLICAARLGEAAERVEQIRTTPWVGKNHGMAEYFRASVLMNEMGRVALGQ
jgi:hypothetical protein